MCITLDNVSCLLYLSIRGRLLNHNKINIDDALEMMLDYLGAEPGDAIKEVEAIRRAHVRFQFLERLYT